MFDRHFSCQKAPIEVNGKDPQLHAKCLTRACGAVFQSKIPIGVKEEGKKNASIACQTMDAQPPLKSSPLRNAF